MAAQAVRADDITGVGSTFVYPGLSKCSATFHTNTRNQVNYRSIGSGGGIAQIKAATVTFGASDIPMKPEDLQASRLSEGAARAALAGLDTLENFHNSRIARSRKR